MSSLARLRGALALFFAALAVPTAALIHQAYQRLEWESFHQHQGLAEEFSTRIDRRLHELAAAEDARPFTEYSFFNVVSPRSGAVLQRSPLANTAPLAGVPGLVGHFQVDSEGRMSVPFEPPTDSDETESGLTVEQRHERAALAARLRAILASNRLLGEPALADMAVPVPERKEDEATAAKKPVYNYMLNPRVAPPSSSEFDRLNAPAVEAAAEAAAGVQSLGRVADLKLEQNFQGAPVMAEASSALASKDAAADGRRELRKEKGVLPERAEVESPRQDKSHARDFAPARVHTFESEVGRFEASLLASGELVLFRNVWRGRQRYVQGLVIDRERFLGDVVAAPFRASPLSRSTRLVVARRGEVVLRDDGEAPRDYASAADLRGTLLYQSRLSAPFSDFELIFSVTRLPAGPGARVIAWLAVVLAVVLGGGLWLALRLGTRQLALARQQQDFIAAVSHELKTPLTSIRMYGEMLREGWAREDKRQEYYRFIHDEAERLTRLINNVLNLARMSRNELKVEIKEVSVAELIDMLRSKLDSVVTHAGRRYSLECAPALSGATLEVDVDCFTQVVLNLVDNALKFSDPEQEVRLSVQASGARHVEFRVRDYGAGIPQDEVGHIFALFHRGANALTRATAGTGIGLALVKRLVEVMGGEVSVTNRAPGAEFCVRLPRGGG